jgi:hypothetical protein
VRATHHYTLFLQRTGEIAKSITGSENGDTGEANDSHEKHKEAQKRKENRFMNLNLRMLIRICVVAVLVASLASAAVAKKPEEPEPEPPDFVINAIHPWDWNNGPVNLLYPVWTGYYSFAGAIYPEGKSVLEAVYNKKGEQVGETLTLTSSYREGSATISISQRFKKGETRANWSGRFVVVFANGDYAFLRGATGSATGGFNWWYNDMAVKLEGYLP